MTTAPGARRDGPDGPNSTASACAALTTITSSSPASRATSAGEAAADPPASASAWPLPGGRRSRAQRNRPRPAAAPCPCRSSPARSRPPPSGRLPPSCRRPCARSAGAGIGEPAMHGQRLAVGRRVDARNSCTPWPSATAWPPARRGQALFGRPAGLDRFRPACARRRASPGSPGRGTGRGGAGGRGSRARACRSTGPGRPRAGRARWPPRRPRPCLQPVEHPQARIAARRCLVHRRRLACHVHQHDERAPRRPRSPGSLDRGSAFHVVDELLRASGERLASPRPCGRRWAGLQPANRSTTGSTRRSSSATGTGRAPGRVDSPPTSTMSAPSAAGAARPHGRCGIQVIAAVREAVGGHVEDAHQPRPVERRRRRRGERAGATPPRLPLPRCCGAAGRAPTRWSRPTSRRIARRTRARRDRQRSVPRRRRRCRARPGAAMTSRAAQSETGGVGRVEQVPGRDAAEALAVLEVLRDKVTAPDRSQTAQIKASQNTTRCLRVVSIAAAMSRPS